MRHYKRERDDGVERERSGRLEWRESGKVGWSREGGPWSQRGLHRADSEGDGV
jgi:hypothetical protein